MSLSSIVKIIDAASIIENISWQLSIWHVLFSQMPTKERAQETPQVIFYTDVSEVMRSTLGRKHWIVPTSGGQIRHYLTAYANLSQKYRVLESEAQGIQIVIDAIQEGFPARSFDKVRDFIGISRSALTDIVHISPRTLARRATLKTDESERLFRVANVFQRAVEVLGSRERAHRWFMSPQKALGEKTPLSFCQTEPGSREVEDLLGRLEHGVFS